MTDNSYFHFISNDEPDLGPLNGLLSTTDSLFVFDFRSGSEGRIYQIQAIPVAGPDTAGPSVVSRSPTGDVTGSVDRMTLTFSEAIQDGSFTAADIVVLTGPGGAIVPTAVNKISPAQYEVVFPEQSALGSYTLTIGPAIVDLADNPMNQDGDGVNGETPQDQFTTSFSLAEAPTITSPASVNAPENQTAAADMQSTDPEGDTEGSGLSYSLTGSVDDRCLVLDRRRHGRADLQQRAGLRKPG